jgi:sugar phosphate isomerase/epimerase
MKDEMDLSRFAINQITTPRWNMAQAIEGYARHKVGGIAVWRHFLDEYGISNTANHLRDAGLWVASLCTSAWFNAPLDAGGIAKGVEDNKRILDQAAAIGAPCVVMVLGGMREGDKKLAEHRAAVYDALFELKAHARSVNVKIGLEPLHPMYAGNRSVLNRIKDANEWCDALGDDASLVPDTYHSWWDPDFETELRRAGAQRISTFHLCDWLADTRNLRDRGMVGDGVIDFAGIRAILDDIGYTGPFELELFSELDWWERDPDETVRIGIERCLPYVGPLSRDRG